MFAFALALLAGVVFLQFFLHLPSAGTMLFLVVAASAGVFFLKKFRRYTMLPLIFLLGFGVAWWHAQAVLQQRIPAALEGVTLSVEGQITGIPVTGILGQVFLLKLASVNGQPARGIVRLMWTDSQVVLQPGDVWKLNVRLKKPYGTMNPGGFDYEAFAAQADIAGNGYVLMKEPNARISQRWFHGTIDRIRQYLQKKILANLPPSQTSVWIEALAIGERREIPSAAWQVLRNTGTNHLMAIAGLHIGFIAYLAHVSMAFVWRNMPRLPLKIPAVLAGAFAALLAALLYSAMAGFSIPAQRACCMLVFFLLALLMRRTTNAWQAWSGALMCVLLLNPLSVLTDSFWLSFGSVAWIIYGVNGRLFPDGLWWKWGRIQWVIACGLVPLSIACFQQCSLISFVANMIAIPWVGFVVAPLSLAGTLLLLVSDKLGGWVLLLADKILGVLWIILTWLAHLPAVVWYHPASALMIAAGMVAMIFLLLPRGFPGRGFCALWILPLILFKPAVPPAGTAWLTLLDVGQGLSAVVQTQHHVLVFDTGPRLGASFDMGESVVVPFLHSQEIHVIDMLVISHKDNDHSGGAAAVLQQFPVLKINTSVPQLFAGAEYCLRGMRWQWDKVDFEFLYPTPDKLALNNDSSCVLRISIGDQHILLTGDIEKAAEQDLVTMQNDLLPAQLIVAPHHGSKTSAKASFLQAVHPQMVLFAVGYRNRYHFPNTAVLKAYRELGVVPFDTVSGGAMRFAMSAGQPVTWQESYRQSHKHYWNN
jgi:competence protein ComEC